MTVRATLDGFGALGLDVDAIMASAGLSRAQLDATDGFITFDVVAALWQEAQARFGQPHVALATGRAIPFGSYEVVDYLATSARTVAEGFADVSRLFALILTDVTIRIELRGTQVVVELAGARAQVEPSPLTIEMTWAIMASRFRNHGHPDFVVDQLTIPYEPVDPAAFGFVARGLKVAPGPSTLTISTRCWRLPMQREDGRLRSILEQHAASLLAEQRALPDSFLSQVQAAIARRLRDPAFGIELIAEELDTSPRTLQRRLGEEGLKFRAVVDGLREGLARQYLGSSRLSVQEIAYLLGYSDATAFSRAFRRRTGSSPQRYRAGARAG